jgi:hypothetical protein
MARPLKIFFYTDRRGMALCLMDWGWGAGLCIEGHGPGQEPYVAVDAHAARVIASVLVDWADEQEHEEPHE